MSESEIKLVINKTINAPVEKVYAAWTDAEIIKQWFGPSEQMIVPNAESDARKGGSYLIHVRDADSDTDHIVSGEYEEVVLNQKLVFDWKWKDGVDKTRVMVEFQPKDGGQTLLTLTHTGFSEQEFADKHNQGWAGCLNGLENYFS